MATQGWNGGKGKILLDVYLTSNCWEPDNKTLKMKSRMKTKLFFLSLLFDSYFVKGSWMKISLLMAIKILGILLSPPNLMISVLITTISTKTRMCEKCLWQERRYHTERIYIFLYWHIIFWIIHIMTAVLILSVQWKLFHWTTKTISLVERARLL